MDKQLIAGLTYYISALGSVSRKVNISVTEILFVGRDFRRKVYSRVNLGTSSVSLGFRGKRC